MVTIFWICTGKYCLSWGLAKYCLRPLAKSVQCNDYLSNTNTNTFFLTPTVKNEISFIILDSHKSSGPNSIPVKILKLLKNDISQQLSDIFNMSFLTGQFPSVLKIAKVIPIHKKQSKVDYANYRPISLLTNIEKMIEKLMYKRPSNFQDINNMIYVLFISWFSTKILNYSCFNWSYWEY